MSQRGSKIARAVSAALTGACAFVSLPQLARAQDVAAGSLEEVIVTAQRREQALQDVPIAIHVIDEQLIDDVAAQDMGDLAVFVPGLEVSSGSPTQPRYTIRGIQTGDFGVGTDPAVGVYVDGVYAARTGASLLAFNDIERIEVLKGPQGTLFGRSSAAGAVSIVTREPQQEFEAEARLRISDYDGRYLEGMLNLPVGDTLAFRFNAVYNESNGWLEDDATGKDLIPEENWATRAAVKWDVTDSTSLWLTWDHDELDQLARPAIGIVTVPTDGSPLTYPADPDNYLDPRKVPIYNDVVGNEESRSLDQLNLFVDHSFAFADFRSTTSWRQFETVNREDEDGTNRQDLYFDTANIEDNSSFYQEFKFSGATDRIDWVAGVSYYSEDADQTSDTHLNTDAVDTVLRNLGLAPTPDGTLFGFTSDVLAANGFPVSLRGLPWREPMVNHGEFESWAVFGDAIWHVNDRLNLTFGLRYSDDKKEFSWENGARETPELDATLFALQDAGFFQVFPIPFETYFFDLVFDFNSLGVEGEKVSLEDSFDDISPRFVVDYSLGEDSMVFLSVAKGYKAGGFNSVQPLSRFDNEDVWNYEAGTKNVFSDLSLVLNGSVYYYVYENKQSISLVIGDNGIGQYVVNSSDQEAWGVDLEAIWQPLDGLSLSASLAWIDASYKKYVTPDSGQNLAGEPTGQPYLSAALGASYEWNLGDSGGLDASLRYAYRGETRCNEGSGQQGSCQVTPNFEVGEAQHRTDVRLGWTSASDMYSVAAFVNNVFDEQYVEGVNNLTTGTLGTPFATISAPRLWGVEFGVKF